MASGQAFLIFSLIILLSGFWFNYRYSRWELAVLSIISHLHDFVQFVKTDGTQEDVFRNNRAPVLPNNSTDHDYLLRSYSAKDGTNLDMWVLVPKNRSENSKFDVFYEMHGGGFTQGHPLTTSVMFTYLPEPGKYVVFSPQYRLAPEFPFPHAPEDCYAGLKWVREHAKEYGGDPARIIVGGTSAGGNLAAVMSLLSRDDPDFTPKPMLQILHVPATDLFLRTKSFTIFTDTPILNTAKCVVFRYYLAPHPEQWSDPRLSPFYAQSHANLPPAFVIVNELDPISDDGKIYYELLTKSGVPTDFSSIHTYHAGDVIAWNVFGGYKKEITECREKLNNFIQTHVKKSYYRELPRLMG